MAEPPVRVAVLYNAPTLPRDHPDAESEWDVVEVAGEIAQALRRQGIEAAPLPAASPLSTLVASLELGRIDVVFNLIEGFGGTSAAEPWVTGLLELAQLPYTGCPPEAQGLCRSKARTKALLTGYGLPTAPFVSFGDCPFGSLDRLPFPVLVKPDSEDASLGISQSSVVENDRALKERVEWLAERYGPNVLVEAYLPGPEYNIGLIELGRPCALPIAEVVFNGRDMTWPVLTYDAKWSNGSSEDLASPIRCPAEIAPLLKSELEDLAIRAFRATGCRDYARVDIRLDADGRPMILEVNPNPDIGPTSGWSRALQVSGRSYDETLAALVMQALRRGVGHGRG